MSEAAIPSTPSKQPASAPAKKRLRSPSYPFVNLKRAIELAAKLWDAEKRHSVTIPIVCGHWGLSTKSSAGLLSVAALKKFGLLVEEGAGTNRTVRLSDFGLEIVKNKDVPEELERFAKNAALKPEIHRDLWMNFRDASDASMIRHLVFDLKFNDKAAPSVVEVYRETIAFAKLTASDTVENTDDGDEPQESETPPMPALASTATPAKPLPAYGGGPSPLTVSLPTHLVVAEKANMTRQYRAPLDEENDVEIRFFGSEFGVPQLEQLADFVEYIKKGLQRKSTPKE